MTFLIASLLPIAAAQAAEPITPMLDAKNQSYMVIDLKERANDYKEAFDNLKKEKGVGKVFFQLANGNIITNIVEMTLTGNGHLILFKFNTTQGIKFQVVPVEQITALSYTP